jgi:hypothetical protein
MGRAQSVISEIVTHLERGGLLEREVDRGDRRRTRAMIDHAQPDGPRPDAGGTHDHEIQL